MNRLIGRTYRSIVKAKLARLEEQFGIQIVGVNPAYTSQECSRCHYVSKNNRKSQNNLFVNIAICIVMPMLTPDVLSIRDVL